MHTVQQLQQALGMSGEAFHQLLITLAPDRSPDPTTNQCSYDFECDSSGSEIASRSFPVFVRYILQMGREGATCPVKRSWRLKATTHPLARSQAGEGRCFWWDTDSDRCICKEYVDTLRPKCVSMVVRSAAYKIQSLHVSTFQNSKESITTQVENTCMLKWFLPMFNASIQGMV